MASDFERIGGAPAVAAVVEELYKRVTVDPLVGHYFDSVDLPRLKRHMVLMLTSVLGGPEEYEGRTLEEAHQPLHISDEDYARVGEHLMAILAEAGAPEDVQGDVAGVLGAVRPQVVSKD
jgi:hemoglobin